MNIRTAVVVCALAAVCSAAFAADLGKYKSWPNSPQGYFMTKADRAEWSKLQTEADAEQFIAKFVASRGASFASDVADATKAADDHLTVGGTLGSRTLRGKIVILLGPPASFSISQKETKNNSSTANTALNAANGGGAKGGGGAIGLSASDMIDASYQSDMSRRLVHIYNFSYAKDKLPGHPSKDVVINVEVDPSSGDDRITDTRMARQVSDLLDAAAEARAAATPKATP